MKKIILITLGILTLTALIAGVWAYQHFFVPDPEIEAQLAKELPEGFYDFSDLDEEDPTVTGTVSTNQKSNEQSNTGNQSNTSNASSTDSTQSNNSGKNNSSEPITLESIENIYLPRFNRLENKAIDRLDELFEIAAQEYKQNQKDGTLDKSAFARKYMQAATKLQTAVDETFDQVIAQMESELKENKLPTDSIKAIKKQYNEAISLKKSELYTKISGS